MATVKLAPSVTLSFLLHQLAGADGTVAAAKEVRLLNEPSTRSAMTDALLSF